MLFLKFMCLIFSPQQQNRIRSLLSEASNEVSNARTDLAFKVFKSWVISAGVSEQQKHGLSSASV